MAAFSAVIAVSQVVVGVAQMVGMVAKGCKGLKEDVKDFDSFKAWVEKIDSAAVDGKLQSVLDQLKPLVAQSGTAADLLNALSHNKDVVSNLKAALVTGLAMAQGLAQQVKAEKGQLVEQTFAKLSNELNNTSAQARLPAATSTNNNNNTVTPNSNNNNTNSNNNNSQHTNKHAH